MFMEFANPEKIKNNFFYFLIFRYYKMSTDENIRTDNMPSEQDTATEVSIRSKSK